MRNKNYREPKRNMDWLLYSLIGSIWIIGLLAIVFKSGAAS